MNHTTDAGKPRAYSTSFSDKHLIELAHIDNGWVGVYMSPYGGSRAVHALSLPDLLKSMAGMIAENELAKD